MTLKCTRCSWYKNKYDINLAGFDGKPDADIVFVGEAYGKSEAVKHAETGKTKCFIGKAGFKFKELLDAAKLKRSAVAVMNSQRCYYEGNKTPTASEMDACFIHVKRDLNKIKPKLVVALGASALYQTTGKTGLSLHRSKLLWSDKINCKVFVTYHPAAVIYDATKWEDLLSDFRKIPDLIDAEPNEIKHYLYEYIDTADRFYEVYHSEIDFYDEIKFDIETTGLDIFHDKITLLQIGLTLDKIYVIDGNIIPEIQPDLINIFKEKTVVGQGYEFDAKFLAVQHDIFPEKWGHDTCLAEFLLSGMKDNDLTFLTGKYVNESFGYDDEIISSGGAHKVKDLSKLRQYAADDVGVLFPIKKKQYKKLCKNNQDWLLNNITIPCNKVLTKMSIRGVQYDIDQLWKIDTKYKKKAEKVLNKAMILPGIKECQNHFRRTFNPKSSQMIKWLMLEYYQLPVLKTTDKGNPSIGKGEMKIYAEKHHNKYAKIMELYRSYEGIRSSFLSGVLPHLVKNVAHTRYSLHAAATGRPVSSDPNLQNIPRDKDVKSVFKARPGYIFLYSDLSQIEVRVAAMLSQDPTLMEACQKDDFHSTIASKLLGIPYDEFYHKVKIEKDLYYKELRNVYKSIGFGVLYGMSEYGLSYSLNISVEEAKEFIDKYFAGMPRVKQFMEKVKENVIRYGWSETYFGFKRYFFKHSPDDLSSIREGQNHPVQGTAWNLMQLILIEVDKYLEPFKSKLIMQTYDSLVVEAKEEELDTIAPNVINIMTSINKPFELLNTVDIKTDPEVGYNLRDLEDYVI